MSVVNPATCVAMFDVVADDGCKAIIQTAACSALGRMIDRFFTSNGIKVINVVRRHGQVDRCKHEKSAYIANSSTESFEEDLKKLITEVKPTYLLDAVGGKLTGTILNLMPPKSTAMVYGLLSGDML
jgi:NADPH:quinone reductase-like Zn-dependent oxidoreductase